MPSRRAGIAFVAAVLFLALTATAAASSTRYDLSLGDSLAQGMQPNASGITVNTDQGYADQLYAIERRRMRHLKLVKLGCGGETTTSFLTGKGNSADAFLLGCHPAGGSQMAAAERFLRRHSHRGEVALVTVDIGANDVDGCEQGDVIAISCVMRGVERLASEPPRDPAQIATRRCAGNADGGDDAVRPLPRALPHPRGARRSAHQRAVFAA